MVKSRVIARPPAIPSDKQFGVPRRIRAWILGLGLALGGVAALGAAEYTVKSGDTLSAIAKRHGVTVAQLRSWNGIKDNMIRPGQKLVVSQGDGGASKPAAAADPAPTRASQPTATEAPPASLPGASGMLTEKLVTDLAAAPALSEYLYSVQEGDSLAVIAKRFGTSVKAIQWINDLGSDVIRIEQQLLVPSTKSADRGKLITSHGELPADEKVHAVARGESLSSIAAQYQTTVTRLRWRNGLKSNALTSGQQVIIPGRNVSDALPTPAPQPTAPATVDAEPKPLPAPTELPSTTEPAPTTTAATLPEKIDTAAQEAMARSGDYLELIHTVQAGETVASIATAKASSQGAIRWLNDLGAQEVQANQVIIIPTYTAGSAGLQLSNYDPLPASGPSAGTEITHEVSENDSLALLASQYKTTLARLRWRNKLPTNDIHVGQKLIVVTTRPPVK